jgi:hypothetical protein
VVFSPESTVKTDAPREDRELVAALRAGDETLFARLVREHGPGMLRIARNYVWEVELEGAVVEGERLVAAHRGRLLRRVDAWTDQAAKQFGRSCAEEARRRVAASPDLEGYAADAEETAEPTPQVAAFAAARVAELQDGPAGYDAERTRQARWLAEALGLVTQADSTE